MSKSFHIGVFIASYIFNLIIMADIYWGPVNSMDTIAEVLFVFILSPILIWIMVEIPLILITEILPYD